jgi:magnesium-protoporphyrin O-methyltransferase
MGPKKSRLVDNFSYPQHNKKLKTITTTSHSPNQSPRNTLLLAGRNLFLKKQNKKKMAFTSSIFSHIPLSNQRIFPPNSHKPKPPRTTVTTAALPPLAAVTAADLDGTTLAVIGGGSVAALAAAISLTDPERRRRLQAEEVGGGDKEVVREYFNNSGFQRWRKIYGETDEVNRVQKDIRLGHSQTVENVLKMLKDEGSLEGVSVCDAGCGTGCLAIPLAKEGAAVYASDISAAMVAEAEKQVS